MCRSEVEREHNNQCRDSPFLKRALAGSRRPVKWSFLRISQFRGCVVLSELLGYQRVKGRYEFTADDLVKRVSSVSEGRIAAYVTSPVKGTASLRRTSSRIWIERVHSCLNEVKQFGLWALNHNYRKLAAV